MAPMTKGSNLPYRQLCIELGARVTMSEMTVARKLKQRRRGEFALIRRAPQEPFFGVQLAGNDPDEMAWAAALVEARGADLVDVNLGLSDRSLHPQGSWRRARAAAVPDPPDRRGDEGQRRARAGHGQDPSRMERQDEKLPRGRRGSGRRRRRCDLRPRSHASGALHHGGGLGCDRRGRGGRRRAGGRKRRSPVPPRNPERRSTVPAAPA